MSSRSLAGITFLRENLVVDGFLKLALLFWYLFVGKHQRRKNIACLEHHAIFAFLEEGWLNAGLWKTSKHTGRKRRMCARNYKKRITTKHTTISYCSLAKTAQNQRGQEPDPTTDATIRPHNPPQGVPPSNFGASSHAGLVCSVSFGPRPANAPCTQGVPWQMPKCCVPRAAQTSRRRGCRRSLPL